MLLTIAKIIIYFGLMIPILAFSIYEFYCTSKFKELSTAVFGYLSLIVSIFLFLSGVYHCLTL